MREISTESTNAEHNLVLVDLAISISVKDLEAFFDQRLVNLNGSED